MKVLFIHQNFPGQFIHLSAELAKDQNNRVVALGMNDRPVPKDVELRRYALLRPSNPDTHPLLLEQEAHILRAEACAAAALQLKREAYIPDIIIAHPGWGEALFIKDVFPTAKLVIYCEYYYALEGQDVGFDPDTPPLTFQQQAKLRLKNTTNLLSLQIADAAISPTQWQKSTYPGWAQQKITVIHDGIDIERLRFNPAASISLQRAEGPLNFAVGAEVLTFIARNLEPVRGFHMLMRTLPEVQKLRPNVHTIIVGGDEVSYGHSAPNGLSWKSHMLNEMEKQLDMSRIHFVGKIPYSSYLDLLSVSRVHTYWTNPFVLSWSFLEALANGLPVIASDTAPAIEFEQFGFIKSGFFDCHGFATQIAAQLETPVRQDRTALMQAVERQHCLSTQLALLKSV
jgi:glycosyltransferase involved in cell wall biosynthesis